MCLCCLLVLDHTLLYRSIYLRGIPLEGLPMIFYRQLARQVGVVHAVFLVEQDGFFRRLFVSPVARLDLHGQIHLVGHQR